jgi:hypothetical protein
MDVRGIRSCGVSMPAVSDRDNVATVPNRLRIARRWQWPAAIVSAFFFISCFVGWPLGYWLPSAIGLIGFLPAVWLFCTNCHKCG